MSIVLVSSVADRRLLDERKGIRAMTWVMAIMLFLTVLAGALGLATLATTRLLDRQLAGRLTVQIVEPAADARAGQTAAALAALRAMPAVRRAEQVDHARVAALLQPFLGSDGADPDLPIPAMIDVDLTGGDDAALGSVTAAVKAAAPAARIDSHASWISPISRFMATVSGLSAALVLLMATATAAVVILAARASLETHRDTIEVLHMLGSTDVQVARLFQRRIALDTLFGGGIGTAAALLVTAAMGYQLAALGSDLLDGLRLGVWDWLILACLPLMFVLMATLAARFAVLGTLRRML